ncbi:hypothetical protein H0H93_004761, partial [Arthromyces matolae]
MSFPEQAQSTTTETTPLLQGENNEADYGTTIEDKDARRMFWEEFWTLPRYALPVLG